MSRSENIILAAMLAAVFGVISFWFLVVADACKMFERITL